MVSVFVAHEWAEAGLCLAPRGWRANTDMGMAPFQLRASLATWRVNCRT